MGYRSKNDYRIAMSVWSNIFHNRFYLGETWLKKGDVPTRGNHHPLTNEDTFARVQQVMREHDNYKQRTQHHKYLLRGLLYSLDADSPCWVETHPKSKASYYRTRGKSNGGQIFYNTRDVDQQLVQLMQAITIQDSARVELSRELEKWFEEETNGSGELCQSEARLAKLEKVEKNLQRLVIEEEISFEDFKEHRARIEAERARLKNTVESIKSRQHLVRGDFEIALQLASELGFLFEEGNFDERRLLCETVFKRLYVRDGAIVKAELNSPFSLIAGRAEGSESFLCGEPSWKHSELFFDKKQLIPHLQQLLISYSKPAGAL